MAEVIENLYDLHNHLLFGIDDGARNASDTEAMLKEAVQITSKSSPPLRTCCRRPIW